MVKNFLNLYNQTGESQQSEIETFSQVKTLEDITGSFVKSISIEDVKILSESKIYTAAIRFQSLPFYVFYSMAVIPIVNVIIRGGGKADSIKPKVKIVINRISPEMRKLGRVLVTVDGALETLLILADKGTLDMDILIKDVIPEDSLSEVVSKLRQCDLVEINDRVISLTLKAVKIVENLRARLKYKR
jgi:hypothetical protein